MTTLAARQLELFGPPHRVTPRPFDAQRLTQMALGIFNASRPVQGTLGERFFAMRRLAVPSPDVVRFHASLKFNDVRAPGLVWKLVDQRTGEPCGCVRLFLDADGWVIGKRILGRAWGASISRAPRPP